MAPEDDDDLPEDDDAADDSTTDDSTTDDDTAGAPDEEGAEDAAADTDEDAETDDTPDASDDTPDASDEKGEDTEADDTADASDEEGEEAASSSADDDDDDGGYDLPDLDDDVLGSRDDYPDAEDEDFEEDAGDWTADDYHENAKALFGDHEHFGDTAHSRYVDLGYEPHADHDGLASMLEQHTPGSSGTLRFYQKDGNVVPRGFITSTALALLEVAFPQIDFSSLDVTVPRRPRIDPSPGEDDAPRGPQPLPDALASISPGDKVDLRKFATPIGDQGSTSRCAAFAWTHAREMLGNVLGRPVPRLACSFTMMQFQKRQGDFKDFAYAFRGGDGTEGTWEPGKHILDNGTCREDFWPNDDKQPRAAEDQMMADARNHALDADVYDISVDDMRKVLAAGFPVQLSMATGDAFQDIGRDGLMKMAEAPKGQHGYHAMLCVGYVGNYFIVKNSWGEDWGDNGYCYIPKAVLIQSEPEPVAIVPKKAAPAGMPPPGQSPPGPGPSAGAAAVAAPQYAQQQYPQQQAYYPPQQHYPQQQYPQQQYPQPQQYPQQEYPQPQQYPRQEYPQPQAYPPQGYPPQAPYPQQGYPPPQAYPPQPPPQAAPALAKHFCSQCGAQLAAGARFCAGCGARNG